MKVLSAADRRVAAVVALGGLLAVLDTTIVVIAIPRFMSEFDSSLVEVQWIVSGYGLGMIAAMPLSAWLSARYGARRSYLVALAVFAGATGVAGLSASLAMLIAARVVQGSAGGLINPIGSALAMRDVAPELRSRVMAITGLPLMIGPIAGPLLGGLILNGASWRWLFFVTLPVCALGFAGAWRWLRADSGLDEPVAPDVGGALLLVPGVVALALGFSGEAFGAGPRAIIAVIGVVLVVRFVHRSRARVNPLVDVRLFSDRQFGRNALVVAAYAAPYFGTMLLLPSYVQAIRGDSALTAALLVIPSALGMGLAIQLAARILEKVGARTLVSTGLALAIGHAALLALVLRVDTSYAVIAALATVQGIGTGLTFMPSMTSAVRRLGGRRLASGTTLLPITSMIANTLGTAAVSALFAAGSTAVGPVDAYRLTVLAAIVPIAVALVVRLRTPAGAAEPARMSHPEVSR